MANKFKYNKTGTEIDSIFKGNWAIDTTAPNSGGGPSNETGLYMGANIPDNGYAVYSSNGVYTATTDDELLGKVRDLGGDWSSVSAALIWASTQSGIVILNKPFDNKVTDGLVLNIDPSNISSFVDSQPTINIATDSMLLYGWAGGYTVIDSATKTFNIETKQNNSATTSAWRTFYWRIPEYVGFHVTISAKVKWVSESGAAFRNFTIGQGNTGTYPYHFTGSAADDKIVVSDLTTVETYMTWSGIINETGAVGFTQWIDSVTQNGGNAVLQVSNVQIEAKSSATPFVNGTRIQSTQSRDLSEGNNHGTLTNGPLFDSNNYITFDGIDDRISIPNPLSHQSNLNQEWTVMACVNVGSKTFQKLVGGLNAGVYVVYSADRTLLYLAGGANDYYTYGGDLSELGWVMATFRFRNSDGYRTIWKNGTSITTSGPNKTSTPSGMQTTLYIGDGMDGSLSNILIYDRVISDAEVLQNYYKAPIVTDNLDYMWDAGNLVSFDQNTVDVFNLSDGGSGNVSNGTLVNGVEFNKNNGGYWIFDGTDDQLLLEGGTTTNVNLRHGDNWTVNAWVKTSVNTSSTGGQPVLSNSSGGPVSSVFKIHNNKIGYSHYAHNDGGWLISQGVNTITDNQWHLLTWSNLGDGTMDLYVDGVFDSNVNAILTSPTSSNWLDVIGASWYTGSGFDGSIANVQINSITMNQNQVTQNFNAQRNRFGI